MMRIDGRTLDHKTLEHLRHLAVRREEDGERPALLAVQQWRRKIIDPPRQRAAEAQFLTFRINPDSRPGFAQ